MYSRVSVILWSLSFIIPSCNESYRSNLDMQEKINKIRASLYLLQRSNSMDICSTLILLSPFLNKIYPRKCWQFARLNSYSGNLCTVSGCSACWLQNDSNWKRWHLEKMVRICEFLSIIFGLWTHGCWITLK